MEPRLFSSEYYKRRMQLIRTYSWIWVWSCMSVLLLLGVSLVEGWAVRTLLSRVVSGGAFVSLLTSILFFLGIYCIVLARMALQIIYYAEHKKIAQTVVSFALLCVYLLFLFKMDTAQPILFLAVGKLLCIFLLFRFWEFQLRETRLRDPSLLSQRVLFYSWKAFFVCRWVLIACWLMLILAASLALVSVQPVVDLKGWEGLVLLLTFFGVFRVFVANPNAHHEIIVHQKVVDEND